MTRRADGVPIRVASKSVRCRALLDDVLGREGYRGVLAFTLPEALWLFGHGVRALGLALPPPHPPALPRDPASRRLHSHHAPLSHARFFFAHKQTLSPPLYP